MARKSRPQSRNSKSETSQSQIEGIQAQEGRDDALLALTKQFESSHQTLQDLLGQVADIQGLLRNNQSVESNDANCEPFSVAWNEEKSNESERLRDQVFDLEAVVEELKRQNSDLASQLASRCVESSISTGESVANETLSWEERKQMILNQMEADSFDAESFIADLGVSRADEALDPDALDPIRYVQQLQTELNRREEELQEKDQQVSELQHLLDQQSETRSGGIAIGAAAITQMFDADELVREERERLQQLQDEWEEKFRQAEIEASLERAKLSRERQEVARKLCELEEQLADAQRDARTASQPDAGVPSRRWLAKLGLAEGSS